MHVYSTDQRNNIYQQSSDFIYKIELASGKEYYFPAYETFAHFVLDISDIDTIDKIKITSNVAGKIYVVLSYAVAVYDELPLDIYKGIKETLDYDINNDIGDGFLVGTITANANDESIDFGGNYIDYLDRFALIKIDDGVNSELHQIKDKDISRFTFHTTYDGNKILNNYVDANVYLQLPVEYGMWQKEIVIPSIVISGFDTHKLDILNELDIILDTWKTDDTVSERFDGHAMMFSINIDCISRYSDFFPKLIRYVRNFVGKKELFINGRKIEVEFEVDPIFIEPDEAHEVIPRTQFKVKVEIREELWQRRSLVKTTTQNTTVLII
jgi:hypothetical protein